MKFFTRSFKLFAIVSLLIVGVFAAWAQSTRELNPETPTPLDQVRAALDERNWALAETLIKPMLSVRPKDPFTYFELARLFENTRRIEASKEIYQSIATLPQAERASYVLITRQGNQKQMVLLSDLAAMRLKALGGSVTPPAPTPKSVAPSSNTSAAHALTPAEAPMPKASATAATPVVKASTSAPIVSAAPTLFASSAAAPVAQPQPKAFASAPPVMAPQPKASAAVAPAAKTSAPALAVTPQPKASAAVAPVAKTSAPALAVTAQPKASTAVAPAAKTSAPTQMTSGVVTRKPAASFSTLSASGAPSAQTEQVLAALKRWTQAWESRDVKAYFANYVADFKGVTASHAQWQKARTVRIESKGRISLDISKLHVKDLGNNKMQLDFVQVYKSDKLNRRTKKTLIMVYVDGQWLIAKEMIK